MKEIQKLSEAKQRLESYVREEFREEAAQAIADMLSAQAQSDVEEVELCVPVKSVEHTIDLGPVSLKRCTQGILFQAKGGLSTLIEPRLTAVYGILSAIMDQIDNDYADFEGEDSDNAQSFTTAWLYVLQAPIFAALDANLCADTAAMFIRSVTEKYEEMMKAELQPETPKEDAEFRNVVEA